MHFVGLYAVFQTALLYTAVLFLGSFWVCGTVRRSPRTERWIGEPGVVTQCDIGRPIWDR